MYRTSTAYLLWLVSGFGCLGFHRFYLGRIGTGLLWMFTVGLGGIGGLVDLFYIPTMVRDSNLRLRYRQALLGEPAFRPAAGAEPAKESLEKVILRTARKNRGAVTPGEVALEGDIPIDQAKKALEKLVSEGYAEMRIRKSGVIAYVFPEFGEEEEGYEEL